jgi:hypothetical protein
MLEKHALSVKILERFMDKKQLQDLFLQYDANKNSFGGLTVDMERARKMWKAHLKGQSVRQIAEENEIATTTVYRGFAAVAVEEAIEAGLKKKGNIAQ